MIEERQGKLYAWEFKYSPRKAKLPKAWEAAYPESEVAIISRENYLEFLT